MKGLVDLLDLGLHHQLHVEGDLAAYAGDEAEEAADLGDAVAHGVPGDLRLAEAEFLHQPGLHVEPARAERGQRAGGAAELADQDARPQLLEALAVALEGGEPGRALVAEGDRHRLLQIAAPCHRRIAVALGEAGERIGNRDDVGFDEVERLADLQDGRGVGDVLGGGAPVAPFAETVPAQGDELLHHRQHRIADPLGLRLQLGEVVFPRIAVPADFIAGVLRNDAEPGLGAGERGLDVEIFLDAILVGENPPHRLGGKDVAEDSGTHADSGHGCASPKWGPIGTKCARPGPWLQLSLRASSAATRRSTIARDQPIANPMKTGRLIRARRARRDGGAGRSDTRKASRSPDSRWLLTD